MFKSPASGCITICEVGEVEKLENLPAKIDFNALARAFLKSVYINTTSQPRIFRRRLLLASKGI
jgi:hypothetical protein